MRHRTLRRKSSPLYLAEALESRLLLAVALADITNVTLSATPKTFTGSLSASNLIDIYKFSATSAGPFNFNAKLTGVTSGDFDLQLVQDKNHNSTLDNGEIIDSSVTRGIHDEHIAHPLTPRFVLPAGHANHRHESQLLPHDCRTHRPTRWAMIWRPRVSFLRPSLGCRPQ
jgi:hypothetical protein